MRFFASECFVKTAAKRILWQRKRLRKRLRDKFRLVSIDLNPGLLPGAQGLE
jgi:hypothetical protein